MSLFSLFNLISQDFLFNAGCPAGETNTCGDKDAKTKRQHKSWAGQDIYGTNRIGNSGGAYMLRRVLCLAHHASDVQIPTRESEQCVK